METLRDCIVTGKLLLYSAGPKLDDTDDSNLRCQIGIQSPASHSQTLLMAVTESPTLTLDYTHPICMA